LIGGGSIAVSGESKDDSGQTWNTEKTNSLSVTGTLVPNKPGKYRMSGWANIVEGLELRYEALG
jgi:hypothetical protein